MNNLFFYFWYFPRTVSAEHSHQLSQSQAEGRGRAERHAAHLHRPHSPHMIESVGEVGAMGGGGPTFLQAAASGWVITALLGLDDFCFGWWGWSTRGRLTATAAGGIQSSRSSPFIGVSTYTFCCLTVRGLVRVIVWSAGRSREGRPPAPGRLENKRGAAPPSRVLTGGGVRLASGRGGGVGGRKRTAVPGREGRGGRAWLRRGLNAWPLGRGGRLTLTRVSDLRP